MNVEQKKDHTLIPANRITSSRYSSNVSTCCLKRSSKLCNHEFRFMYNFFLGDYILLSC